MELNHDFKLAELADCTLGQPYLGFIDLTSGSGQRLRNIARTHGTKELSLLTRSGSDID